MLRDKNSIPPRLPGIHPVGNGDPLTVSISPPTFHRQTFPPTESPVQVPVREIPRTPNGSPLFRRILVINPNNNFDRSETVRATIRPPPGTMVQYCTTEDGPSIIDGVYTSSKSVAGGFGTAYSTERPSRPRWVPSRMLFGASSRRIPSREHLATRCGDFSSEHLLGALARWTFWYYNDYPTLGVIFSPNPSTVWSVHHQNLQGLCGLIRGLGTPMFRQVIMWPSDGSPRQRSS